MTTIEAIDRHGSVIVLLVECDSEHGTGGEVAIEVKDDGCGVSEGDLTRIFSPFFCTNPNDARPGLPAFNRVAPTAGESKCLPLLDEAPYSRFGSRANPAVNHSGGWRSEDVPISPLQLFAHSIQFVAQSHAEFLNWKPVSSAK